MEEATAAGNGEMADLTGMQSAKCILRDRLPTDHGSSQAEIGRPIWFRRTGFH